MEKTLNKINEKLNDLKVKSIKTVRTGDYRIGLTKAIDVINLEIYEFKKLDKTMHKEVKKLIDTFDLSTRYIASAIGKSKATVKQMRGNTKYYEFKDIHYNMIVDKLKQDINQLVRNP